MDSKKSFKGNIIDFSKKVYLKSCLITRNINIRKLPNLPEKKSKRILFISSDNNKVSGAFLCLVELCDFLINKHGLDVFVILPYYGNGKSILDAKNIPNYTINSFGWGIELSRERDSKCLKEISDKKSVNEGAIRKIREFIRINEFDIVHINSSYSYVGAVAALKENIPFVWHIREVLEEGQNNTMWDRKKGNELINKSNKIIAISDAVKEKYSEYVDCQKITTIYDGVDVEKFYNSQKTIFNDSTVKIIFIGNVAIYKGIIDFVEACISLNNIFNDFEVLIVGAGDDQVIADIKNRFSNANMDDRVKFLGYQKDVTLFLNESDIFCMCTRWEAFGRTTVEAMLSGNLVIGANTAGTKDLIEDGVTGLFYEQGNSQDLCEKMLFAINNKSESKEMANNGRQYMFENMSAEKNADEICGLYNEILNH